MRGCTIGMEILLIRLLFRSLSNFHINFLGTASVDWIGNFTDKIVIPFPFQIFFLHILETASLDHHMTHYQVLIYKKIYFSDHIFGINSRKFRVVINSIVLEGLHYTNIQ